MNFVKDILSVDYAAGGVVQAMLPRSMVLHRSGVVARADVAYLVLSGGISYDKTANDLKYSDKYIQCGLADILSGNAPTCAEDDTTTLIASRYSHSDACLVAGDSAYRCNEYVLFGGTGKDAASGEVFTSDEDADTYNSGLYFKDRTSLSSAYFAEFAKVETSPNQAAKLYIFGGAKGFTFQTDPVQGIALASFTEPDLIPYQINVNLGSKDLTTALISLIDLQPAEEALRLFHTVTVLEDNRVLIAGGVGKDVAPNKNALLFQDPNTNVLEFVSKAAMRTGRFGHTATLIRHGLLKGAVLVIGGFTVDQAQGEVKYAPGGEIYIP
jgi:hypothetical protein